METKNVKTLIIETLQQRSNAITQAILGDKGLKEYGLLLKANTIFSFMDKYGETDFEIKRPENPELGFGLREVYDILQCNCVDVINLKHNLIMIVDDEGAINNSKRNYYASAAYFKDKTGGDKFIYETADNKIVIKTQIFGNVLITHTSNFK